MHNLRKALQQELSKQSWDISPTAQDQMVQYLVLLDKWNAVHNLTGIKDPFEMIGSHIVDSLTVFPYLSSGRIIDVGTGAGLPGIPLAILSPENHFFLLDSNHKKTDFVEQAVLELGLDNIQVVCSRVERYQPDELFDLVISRAFSSLVQFFKQAQHLSKKNGKLLAMKGKKPVEELQDLPRGVCVEIIESLKTDKARSLVFMSKGENN